MSASEPTMLLGEAERVSEFPVVAEYAYLNAATQGPLPSRTCRAIERAALQAQYGALARSQEQAPAEVARGQLARLLGTGEDDFVFTANTTHGLNICARGIEWRAGDNVVLPAREFPSVLRTWLQLRELGVEVRLVHTQGVGPTVEELMEAVDARTRAVSCSAVGQSRGKVVLVP